MFYVEAKNAFGRLNAIGCGRVLRQRGGKAVKVWDMPDQGETKISFAVTVDSMLDKETNKRRYLNVNIAVYASRVSEQIINMAQNIKGGETVFFGGIIWEKLPTAEDGIAYKEVQINVLAYPENLLSGQNGTEVTFTATGKRRVTKTRKSDISPVEGYAF